MVKKGAIWWLVDPFHDDAKFHKKELAALLPIARAMSTVVQPVTYIDTFRSLSGEGNFFPLMPIYGDNYDDIKKEALERLKSIYTKNNEKILKEPIFLTHDPENAPSLQQRVESITKSAAKASVTFIALRSHSRTGLKRLYMGSFAETFLLYTTVPALVFRSETAVACKWNRVIFPTDFSIESKTAFLKLLPLFSKMKSSLTIAHVSADFLSYRFKSSNAVVTFQKHENHIKKLGQSFVKLVGKRKIKAEFKLIKLGVGADSTEALLKLAKDSKADLIALAAKSSPLKTSIVGAITRKLVRAASCPVLVHRIK